MRLAVDVSKRDQADFAPHILGTPTAVDGQFPPASWGDGGAAAGVYVLNKVGMRISLTIEVDADPVFLLCQRDWRFSIR